MGRRTFDRSTWRPAGGTADDGRSRPGHPVEPVTGPRDRAAEP